MMKTLFRSLALTAGLLTAWSSAQAATWVTQNANAGISTNLRYTWGLDANNIWATGGNSTNIPLLLKWDGTAWGPVSTTSGVPLYSVWGTSTSNVWVGGRKGHLMRYNGTNWQTVTSGMETDGANGPFFINGLWGTDANNIWGVGGNGEFSRIIKWNGTAWSSQYNVNTNGSLRQVWGTATNNVWAVGDKGLVLHYDGTSWTTVSYSVSPAVATTTLFSIWGSDANNIWIGGGIENSTVTLLKWNGTAISRFDMTGIPAAASVGSVRGIYGTSANNIYIVGDQGPFASHWNGSTWTTQSTGQSMTSLNSVWCTADGTSIWVTGASSTISRGTAAAVASAPTLASTPSGSATSYQAATLGGEVTSTGGSDVTKRGFVYSLMSVNNNPLIGGSNVTDLSETGTYGTGTFSLGATGLTGGSTYSFKAYATNTNGTSYSSVGTFTTLPAPAAEIAISGNSVAIASGDVTPSGLDGTDFGSAAVSGGTVEHTFTIANSGEGTLTVSGASVSGSSAFTISTQPAGTVAANATTTFKVLFDPSAEGVATATVTVSSDDADEGTYTFTVTGSGLVAKTQDLAGNDIVDFPYDGGETYIYSSYQPPVPVPSTLGDVVTSGEAPGANGTDSVGEFDALRRGGFLAENGYLTFPGYLKVGTGTPAVTAASRTGIWKAAGSNLFLLARTGTTVPDVTGAMFDTLPEVPGINEEGEVSFLAPMTIGTGTPAVTASDDTGLWSELGGSGLSLLVRENDGVPTQASATKIATFASGLYATAKTGATTGEAAFSVGYRGGSTKTAVLRASVTASSVALTELAREGDAAPGTAAGTVFSTLSGSYTDPGRMDAQGNFVFSALTTPGAKEGIWYQPVTGGAITKVVYAGDTALGTTGTTFSKIYRPSMGSNGFITFRASVAATGDNAGNLRNDGIWAGNAATPSSITCILRRGDDTAVVSNLPSGSKVGNVWGGWLTNSNRGAWRAWLDVDGNGTSAAPTDKHAIYENLSGTMRLALTAGDAAPGTTGATFSGFDLPVVGGSNQYAFLGTLTGGDVVGTTNNEGVWKSTADGAALNLVLRKGDTMTTSEGSKVIQKLDLPGSAGTDRRWEQPVMDETGRTVIFITFADGSTSQILAP